MLKLPCDLFDHLNNVARTAKTYFKALVTARGFQNMLQYIHHRDYWLPLPGAIICKGDIVPDVKIIYIYITKTISCLPGKY